MLDEYPTPHLIHFLLFSPSGIEPRSLRHESIHSTTTTASEKSFSCDADAYLQTFDIFASLFFDFDSFFLSSEIGSVSEAVF